MNDDEWRIEKTWPYFLLGLFFIAFLFGIIFTAYVAFSNIGMPARVSVLERKFDAVDRYIMEQKK